MPPFLCHSRHVLQPCIQWLANRVHNKTNFSQLICIGNVPSIKDESWFLHVVIHPLVIKTLKLIPLCQNANSMGIPCCLIGIPNYAHLLHSGWTHGLQVKRMIPIELVHCKVSLDLVFSDLRIVYAQAGLVSQQPLAHVNGWGLSCVTSILQCLDGLLAFWGFPASNEDPIRVEKILNCSSLCKELWV
ncbi:hypothetical protein CFOL_v3_09218 [Cephalotus follicularis]|uniref:Uncharacterized protein n=1 Tax=Cephalotus follicularis TaxID=3775 RepID=A0A1Q3BCY0_CEPFO|nr:hypothetical protein CFOL_v3_09218 [Cephalotus follicularis]